MIVHFYAQMITLQNRKIKNLILSIFSLKSISIVLALHCILYKFTNFSKQFKGTSFPLAGGFNFFIRSVSHKSLILLLNYIEGNAPVYQKILISLMDQTNLAYLTL